MLDLLDYQDLPVGETRKGVCPGCGKKKFYVTRKPDGFAYICFRATCSFPPGFTSYHGLPVRSPRPAKSTERVYRGAISPANQSDIEYFWDRFQIDVTDMVRVAGDGRYAFPVFGRYDGHRGYVLRRPIWGGEPRPPRSDTFDADFPKSINYFEVDAVPCGWYHSTDTDTVVIVEDPVSAMRVAGLGVTAVAIYGTHLQDSVIQDLVRFGASEYIFALDPDATGKAISMMTRLMSRVPHTRVAILKHDPKDYDLDLWLEKDLGL